MIGQCDSHIGPVSLHPYWLIKVRSHVAFLGGARSDVLRQSVLRGVGRIGQLMIDLSQLLLVWNVAFLDHSSALGCITYCTLAFHFLRSDLLR